MKALWLLLAVAPSLMALDITTLDGKIYKDCEVSRVFPDSICILYSGGGARVKFSNLSEPLQTKFGYNAEQSAAFERAERAREERERAALAAQRAQMAAQKRAAALAATQQPTVPPTGTGAVTGSEHAAVIMAAGSGGYGRGGGQSGNQFGNQFGGRVTGAEYVGVTMAGIRGVTAPGPAGPGPIYRAGIPPP